MTNKLSQAYGALDKAILNVVGKGVRAYNWTTGDTKAGMANKMLSVAPILESLGCFLANPISVLTAAPIFLFFSHFQQKKNTEMEILEEKAIERNALDYRVEINKRAYAVFGSSWAILGGAIIVPPANEDCLFYGLGNLVRSASYYVMRTDYQPPRKGFVERGIDKLKDAVRSYKTAPQLQPALANPNYSLENLI